MHGLNYYDFHARQYDPVVCRFTSMDPLAEKYYSVSPYAYCLNNPLKYVDPDGKQIRAITSGSKVYRAYRAYKVARAVEGAGFWAAVGVALTSNQMLSPSEESQARYNIMQGVNATSEISSGKAWQDKQDRKGKEKLDQQQANVSKGIEDNVTANMPSGDPAPKRSPKGAGKTILKVGSAAAYNSLSKEAKTTLENSVKDVFSSGNKSNPTIKTEVSPVGNTRISLPVRPIRIDETLNN